MRSLLLNAVALAALFLSACQTVPYQGQARDVAMKPQQEGVISIPLEYRDEDRNKANEKMTRNCSPYRYVVSEEGESVVGQKTVSDSRETNRTSTERQVGSLFGMPLVTGDQGGKDTSNSSVTTQVKEWRISYKCDRKTKAASL